MVKSVIVQFEVPSALFQPVQEESSFVADEGTVGAVAFSAVSLYHTARIPESSSAAPRTFIVAVF